MSHSSAHSPPHLDLRPFRDSDAEVISRWVATEVELKLVAPATVPPLTPAKVLGWRQPGARVFLGSVNGGDQPATYAELNPMTHDPRQVWLGHCIVRPDLRGRGLGQACVRQLLRTAFFEMEMARVSLIVFPDNEPAVRCYVRCGFANVGDEWHQFGSRPAERLLRLEAVAGGGVPAPRPE